MMADAPDFNPHLTPEQMDRYLRSLTRQTGAPTFYGRNILRAAKAVGLDVEKLIADGVIAETQRIPFRNGSSIWIRK